MVVTAENREEYFRSQNKFYVAGWVANEQCELPQSLPESCRDNPVVVKQYEDYIAGYGDCVANIECLSAEIV
tara:strand:- start:3062 stop:3277 length:216 start_codon:yes stop_codon:yes gene_type:complete